MQTNSLRSFNFSLSRILCAALVIIAAGCSKKQTPAAADAAAPQTAAEATPAPASADNPTANAQAAAASPAPVIDPKATVADADAALKAKDYERAAATLITIQLRQQLDEQQAQAVHQRMVQLQSSLASAVSSGDAKAIAAADLLRQSARH